MRPKVKKIEPFFRSLTPKMRVIVYLIGTGEFTLDEIRKMKVSEFRNLKMIENLPVTLGLNDVCSDLSKRDDDELVFVRDSGRGYSLLDMTNILKRAHKIASHKYVGVDDFVSHVNESALC